MKCQTIFLQIDSLFKRGLEALKKGNYTEAETFFIKAKKFTIELQELQRGKDIFYIALKIKIAGSDHAEPGKCPQSSR